MLFPPEPRSARRYFTEMLSATGSGASRQQGGPEAQRTCRYLPSPPSALVSGCGRGALRLHPCQTCSALACKPLLQPTRHPCRDCKVRLAASSTKLWRLLGASPEVWGDLNLYVQPPPLKYRTRPPAPWLASKAAALRLVHLRSHARCDVSALVSHFSDAAGLEVLHWTVTDPGDFAPQFVLNTGPLAQSRLRSLHLSCDCGDVRLEQPLTACSALTELNVSASRGIQCSLTQLAPALVSLSLYGLEWTAAAEALLASASPQLTWLELHSVRTPQEHVARALRAVGALRTLAHRFGGCWPRDVGVACPWPAGLPAFTSLRLDCGYGEELEAALPSLPALQYLETRDVSLSAGSLAALCSATRLTSLTFARNEWRFGVRGVAADSTHGADGAAAAFFKGGEHDSKHSAGAVQRGLPHRPHPAQQRD